MSNIVQKTFSDSYVYNYDKNSNGKLIAKEINAKLIEYITTAERIDKKSEAFEGIKQEVKRQQSFSLLYSILMRDDVVLMVNTIEMPRAFKVFEAIDLKEVGKKRKVFIDVTKLLELSNGFYKCNNIFQFITYLSESVTYLLYRNDPIKFMNNSNVTISATECYVSCFSFILDYLRIIGYSESRTKIQYLAGLFFMHNLMGKDIDNYVKNTAAKIAKIGPTEIKQYELYYDKEDFENIDTFVSMIAETFKLKGLTTEVFITRWIFHFGRGTEYGIDLFTSFCNMIVAAYCGAYVVNQKQIEKGCGRSMIKLTTGIMDIASGSLDKSYYSENAEDDPTNYMSKDAQVMYEAFRARSTEPVKILKEDFDSSITVSNKAKMIVEHYKSCKQESKISGKLYTAARMIIESINNEDYQVGCLESVVIEGNKYFNNKDRRNLISEIEQSIRTLSENMQSDNIKENVDLRRKVAEELSELRRSEGRLI
jgi:hypothetical protein